MTGITDIDESSLDEPRRAEIYLNAILQQCPEKFIYALRKVTTRKLGLYADIPQYGLGQLWSLNYCLTDENPQWTSLLEILDRLGIELHIRAKPET